MKQHGECFRGYHRSSKVWYANAINDNRTPVYFGMYDPDGGTSGEMEMEWIDIDNKQCAKLKAFEDSWSALSLFTDLIQKMGGVDSDLIQEDDFCKILNECGFQDLTEYNHPSLKTEKTIDEIKKDVAKQCAEEHFDVIFESEILVGDYEQARKLWNEVGDRYIKQFEKK